MSGCQLSKLVRYQAFYLALPGIAFGILAGTLVGILLVPFIVSNLSIYVPAKGVIQINGWVLLVSALFSFVTVIVSCRKPARLASKVSPIEAVRYTESVKSLKCGRSSSRFTNLSFAGRNLSRDKKKVFWVGLSLSLSLVILNSVYTLLHGFSEDKYIEHSIATDFSVTDATLDNPSVKYSNRNLTGISSELLDQLNNLKGIEELGNIYLESTYQRFTNEDFQKIDDRLLSKTFFETLLTYGDEMSVKAWYEEERAASVMLYGMDDLVLKNLPVRHGELNLEKI